MPRPVLTCQADFSGTPFGGAPTFTDISDSVLIDGDGEPLVVTYGAQDELDEPVPTEFHFTLDNKDGRYTAVPGRVIEYGVRIRMSVQPDDGTGLPAAVDQADGYVNSAELHWPDGGEGQSVLKVSCSDITATPPCNAPLRSMLEQEMLTDAPTRLYTLQEDAGVAAGSTSTTTQQPAPVFAMASGGTAALGDTSSPPMPESDSCMTVVGTTAPDSGGGLLLGPIGTCPFTIEAVVRVTIPTAWTVDNVGLARQDNGTTKVVSPLEISLGTTASGRSLSLVCNVGVSQASITHTARVDDGRWHHIVFGMAADGKTPFLYIDGVAATPTAVAPSALVFTTKYLRFGMISSGPNPAAGATVQSAYLAIYPTALSAARILTHAQVFAGTLLERSDLRFARIAAYGAVPTSGLPVGKATMGRQTLKGKSIVDALRDVARTEGSVAFATLSGALTFQARNLRYNAAVGLTLTGEDITPDSIVRKDPQGLVNDATATRDGGAAQRVVDAASQAQYGRADAGNFDVFCSTDYDALNNAAWKVATGKSPRQRIPTLTADLLTQPTKAFASSVLAAGISTLVQVSSLPSQTPGGTTATVFIEGGVKTIGGDVWTEQFFTSPNLPGTLRADAAPSTRTKLDAGLKIPF